MIGNQLALEGERASNATGGRINISPSALTLVTGTSLNVGSVPWDHPSRMPAAPSTPIPASLRTNFNWDGNFIQSLAINFPPNPVSGVGVRLVAPFSANSHERVRGRRVKPCLFLPADPAKRPLSKSDARRELLYDELTCKMVPPAPSSLCVCMFLQQKHCCFTKPVRPARQSG